MKRFLVFAAFIVIIVRGGWAAVAVTDVQAELRAQGFYFGELNGQENAEYKAALRRYQIRNGLEPTSQADDQTLEALGLTTSPEPRTPQPPTPPTAPPPPRNETPAQITPAPETPTERRPPVNLRREESPAEERREMRREEPAPEEGGFRRVPPPQPLEAGNAPLEHLRRFYAGTPYSSAPAPVQVDTIRRAQSMLASRGYYRSSIDGDPGPATAQALLLFQQDAGLPRTGRLDLETLNAMRLLPGRARGLPGVQAPRGGFIPPDSRRAPRGEVWVD